MPNSKSDPKLISHPSGEIDIVIPHGPTEVTNVGVSPGSNVHDILVDHKTMESKSEETPSERRKPQPPVNVSVGGTPGLPGWHGVIAQWGAFGVILVLSIAMYSFITSMAKDDRMYIQQRDRDNRDDLKNLFDRMDKRDERIDRREEVLVVVLQSLQTKIDGQTATNVAMTAEFKASRVVLEAKLEEILTQLKKKCGG